MNTTSDTTTSSLPLLQRLKAAIAQGRVLSGIKRRLKPLVVSAGKAALRRSWIKRSVLTILNLSPKLKNRIYQVVWKDVTMSPRAMRIYTTLSTTIPTHTKGSE